MHRSHRYPSASCQFISHPLQSTSVDPCYRTNESSAEQTEWSLSHPSQTKFHPHYPIASSGYLETAWEASWAIWPRVPWDHVRNVPLNIFIAIWEDLRGGPKRCSDLDSFFPTLTRSWNRLSECSHYLKKHVFSYSVLVFSHRWAAFAFTKKHTIHIFEHLFSVVFS